jgi:hypothetical protein
MGRFTLRLPETLHSELEQRAQQEGVSLNHYIIYALTRQVASTYTIQVLPETHVQEQRAHYDALLANLSASSLSATRKFLAEREAVAPEPELTEAMVARLKGKIAAQESE